MNVVTEKELSTDGYANAEPSDDNMFMWKDHSGTSTTARI